MGVGRRSSGLAGGDSSRASWRAVHCQRQVAHTGHASTTHSALAQQDSSARAAPRAPPCAPPRTLCRTTAPPGPSCRAPRGSPARRGSCWAQGCGTGGWLAGKREREVRAAPAQHVVQQRLVVLGEEVRRGKHLLRRVQQHVARQSAQRARGVRARKQRQRLRRRTPWRCAWGCACSAAPRCPSALQRRGGAGAVRSRTMNLNWHASMAATSSNTQCCAPCARSIARYWNTARTTSRACSKPCSPRARPSQRRATCRMRVETCRTHTATRHTRAQLARAKRCR